MIIPSSESLAVFYYLFPICLIFYLKYVHTEELWTLYMMFLKYTCSGNHFLSYSRRVKSSTALYILSALLWFVMQRRSHENKKTINIFKNRNCCLIFFELFVFHFHSLWYSSSYQLLHTVFLGKLFKNLLIKFLSC